MFGGRLPHELGNLPITYFQTLVERLVAQNRPQSRNDSAGDGTELADVDVDALIRKGQREGFSG